MPSSARAGLAKNKESISATEALGKVKLCKALSYRFTSSVTLYAIFSSRRGGIFWFCPKMQHIVMFSFQALYAAGRFEQALVEFHRALRSFQSFISWLHTNQFAWPILRILICSPKTKYFSANIMRINFNIFNIQASLKQPLWGMDQQVTFSFS